MEANNKQVHVDSIDEEIVARVAAIDVAKDSGMVCTRVPHQSQPGKWTTTAWSVSARTNSIIGRRCRPCLRTWARNTSTLWPTCPVRAALGLQRRRVSSRGRSNDEFWGEQDLLVFVPRVAGLVEQQLSCGAP